MCLAFPSRHDRSLQIIPLNRSRFHSSSQLQFFSGFSPLFIFFWSFICHLHTDLKVQFILVLFKSINIHHFPQSKGAPQRVVSEGHIFHGLWVDRNVCVGGGGYENAISACASHMYVCRHQSVLTFMKRSQRNGTVGN